MPAISYILNALAAYLLGSIPTGYLVARARGVDIRALGSGNIGATNAFRVLGKPAGVFVLLMDALKGFTACAVVAPWIFHRFAPNFFVFPHDLFFQFKMLAGIFAVLGHNYTCWLRFKGGKGIATTAGVYFALTPVAVSLALAVWVILFVTTRYVSIASIAAAIALPAAVWWTEASLLLGIVTTALGLLAIYKHKGNIQRLLAGTESRVQFKKEKPAA
jgi:glycerol-3-phosphate acyltransferase PlsY